MRKYDKIQNFGSEKTTEFNVNQSTRGDISSVSGENRKKVTTEACCSIF
jgi:hypothetical protein